MEARVADVTVRLVDPVTDACLAEMLAVCPPFTPVANPLALIVAAAVFEEDQETELVKSCVLLSEKVPVALN